MKIWSRLKKLSIKQLLNLGVVFIQRPLLIRPTLKATSKTISISQKEFGSAQHKNGKPKRTFCYIADAIVGYLNALSFNKFEVFNIGSTEELTIKKFAYLYQKASQEILNYKPNILFRKHKDINYLKDNPNRRCPDLKKSKKMLQYLPKINTYKGIIRYL